MVELCGARLVPGTIDAYPRPGRAARRGAAPRAARAAARRAGPAGGGRADPRARSASRSRRATARLDRDRALLARRRRAARGRPDRGGGAHLRPRQAAHHAARARAGGRPAHATRQRLRRRLEDALRDRGLHEIVAWSFTSPEALERLRLGDVPALRLANPLSEDAAVMRPLLLPGLLDAARHNAAHGTPARGAVRVGARLPARRPARRPGGQPARRDARRGAPPPRRAAHPRRPGELAQRARAGRTSTPPRACVEARARRRGRWSSRWSPARGRSCIPGGPASVAGRATSARSAGSASCTRSSRARGTSRAPRRSSSTPTPSPSEPGGGRAYRDVTSFPAVLQDIAVVVADDVSADEVRADRARGRRRAAHRAPRSSTSTRASRWGRATARWRCGSSSARPTGRSPTRRSPSAGRRSRPRSAEIGGRLRA